MYGVEGPGVSQKKLNLLGSTLIMNIRHNNQSSQQRLATSFYV
jgi:hypothetical protein